jgi:hypothetical protein
VIPFFGGERGSSRGPFLRGMPWCSTLGEITSRSTTVLVYSPFQSSHQLYDPLHIDLRLLPSHAHPSTRLRHSCLSFLFDAHPSIGVDPLVPSRPPPVRADAHVAHSRIQSAEERKVRKPSKPSDIEVLSADPTLRWEHKLTDGESEKRRIEDYKAKRRQRCDAAPAHSCLHHLPFSPPLHTPRISYAHHVLSLPPSPSACHGLSV